MRAYLTNSPGGWDASAVREVPVPSPATTEVLLRVGWVVDLQHVRDANGLERQRVRLPMWVSGGHSWWKLHEAAKWQVLHLRIRAAKGAVVEAGNATQLSPSRQPLDPARVCRVDLEHTFPLSRGRRRRRTRVQHDDLETPLGKPCRSG